MSQTPGEVVRLVERFERNREQYKSASYNETQVRREFIDLPPRGATYLTARCSKLSARSGRVNAIVLPFSGMMALTLGHVILGMAAHRDAPERRTHVAT